MKTRSSVAVSSRQSHLSMIPARERVFAQILIFICLPCLFWYPPDNLCRVNGTGKCWGVSALRWDEGWLYYHFKWSACWVLWFRSSLTCHASLTGPHRSPVLLRAPLSPLFWMTAVVTSSYSSRFPIFLSSLCPTPRVLVPACAQRHVYTLQYIARLNVPGLWEVVCSFQPIKQESLECFEDRS